MIVYTLKKCHFLMIFEICVLEKLPFHKIKVKLILKGKLATINKKQELTESFFAFGVKRGAYGTKVVLIQGQK